MKAAVLSTGKINKSKPRPQDFSNYDSVRRQIFAEPKYNENTNQDNEGNINRKLKDKFSKLKNTSINPLAQTEAREINKPGKLRPFFNHNKGLELSDSYVNIDTSDRNHNHEYSQATKDHYDYNPVEQNQQQNNFFCVEQLLQNAAEKAQQYSGSAPENNSSRVGEVHYQEGPILDNLEFTSQVNLKENQFQPSYRFDNNSISAIGFPFQIPYSRVEENSKPDSMRNLSLHSGYLKGNMELGHSPDISALIHEMDGAHVGGNTLMDNLVNPYQNTRKLDQQLYAFENLPESKNMFSSETPTGNTLKTSQFDTRNYMSNPLGERNINLGGGPAIKPKVIGGLKSSSHFFNKEDFSHQNRGGGYDLTNKQSNQIITGDDFDEVEKALQRSKQTLQLIKNSHVQNVTSNVKNSGDEQEFSHVYSSAPVEGITERIERLLES